MNEPLVSVVMPAYNSEKYIKAAIASVVAQTHQNWDLIAIDDGSRDDTGKIIAEFAAADNRIRFFKNERNLGVSATRNKAIALAIGEWVAFLDSDDMWNEEKLEKQLVLARNSGSDFVFTGSAFVDENGNFYRGTFSVPDTLDFRHLRLHNVIPCSSVMIRKNLLKSVRMERDDIHEDFAAWLSILKSGVIAYGINEPLLIYRISAGSRSRNKLRSAKMTYRVFRTTGCGRVGSAYFLCRHLAASIYKYARIGKLKKAYGEAV